VVRIFAIFLSGVTNHLDEVRRFGWLCGIGGPVLISVGFFVVDEGGTTGPDGSIGVLVDEIVRARVRILVGSVIGMIGALLLIWFVSALRLRLGRDPDPASTIGLAAYGSGVVAAAGAFVYGSFRMALAGINDPRALTEGMRPLAIVGEHVGDVLMWGLVGLVVAMSVGALVVRLLPKAMAIVGLVLCAGAVALSPTDHGGVAAALLPWMAVAGAMLDRSDRAAGRN